MNVVLVVSGGVVVVLGVLIGAVAVLLFMVMVALEPRFSAVPKVVCR